MKFLIFKDRTFETVVARAGGSLFKRPLLVMFKCPFPLGRLIDKT
jgi:hypothetical protein